MYFTLEADSRKQVLVGGDCVQTLPVSQLPNLTGVITTSCRQVVPEITEEQKNSDYEFRYENVKTSDLNFDLFLSDFLLSSKVSNLCSFTLLVSDWLTRWGRSVGCKSPSGVPPGRQHSGPYEGPTPCRMHPAL